MVVTGTFCNSSRAGGSVEGFVRSSAASFAAKMALRAAFSASIGSLSSLGVASETLGTLLEALPSVWTKATLAFAPLFWTVAAATTTAGVEDEGSGVEARRFLVETIGTTASF